MRIKINILNFIFPLNYSSTSSHSPSKYLWLCCYGNWSNLHVSHRGFTTNFYKSTSTFPKTISSAHTNRNHTHLRPRKHIHTYPTNVFADTGIIPDKGKNWLLHYVIRIYRRWFVVCCPRKFYSRKSAS